MATKSSKFEKTLYVDYVNFNPNNVYLHIIVHDCVGGSKQGIRDYLQQMLNFTLNLGSPEDKKWGGLSKDGKTWNGMVRELVDDEIDMCAAGLSITFDRAMATDFRLSLITVWMGWMSSRKW